MEIQAILSRDPEGHTQAKQGFRRLREYLRLYRQRLYLIPKGQQAQADGDSDLQGGMDFMEYKTLRARHRGVQSVVAEHQRESEDMY